MNTINQSLEELATKYVDFRKKSYMPTEALVVITQEELKYIIKASYEDGYRIGFDAYHHGHQKSIYDIH